MVCVYSRVEQRQTSSAEDGKSQVTRNTDFYIKLKRISTGYWILKTWLSQDGVLVAEFTQKKVYFTLKTEILVE